MIKPSAQLYLTFVNDFITIQCFAEWLEVDTNQAQSIIARSKIMWLSEDSRHREHFTDNCLNLSEHYQGMSEHNAKFFCKRHSDNLLTEYSA